MRKKNIMFCYFVFVLYCTKRRYSQIKPHIKVEIEYGRKAPLKPSLLRNSQFSDRKIMITHSRSDTDFKSIVVNS